VPALFDLSQDRSLPADFSVIPVDRVDLGDETLRRRLHAGVKKFSRYGIVKTGAWREFARHIHYQQGDFKKIHTEPSAQASPRVRLPQVHSQHRHTTPAELPNQHAAFADDPRRGNPREAERGAAD
jgi:hypothetical protein